MLNADDTFDGPRSFKTPVCTQQPGDVLTNRGAVSESGIEVKVRSLQDNQEDAEFAARLTVEAFRGKCVHAIGENK